MKRNVSVPGKKGAIARLIVLGLISLIAVLVCFLSLPEYILRVGFGRAVLEAFSGCGLLLLLAAGFWCMMKWLGFIAPKAFRLANSFWQAWIPFTFFGLYLKACGWVLICGVPCAAATVFVTPLTGLGLAVANDLNVLTAFGIFLLGAAAVTVLGAVDICKLLQKGKVAMQ